MSIFSEASRRATDEIFTVMADEATYTSPDGSPCACHVIVDLFRDPLGEFGVVADHRTRVSVRRSEVETVEVGGEFSVCGVTYVVEEILPDPDDDIEWRVTVRG